MTREWYQNNGFNLSVEQAVIDRAEQDVFNAYIKPIRPDADMTDCELQQPLANLAYMLLMKRNLKVTRKGTKTKTDADSVNADYAQALTDQAGVCRMYLDKLGASCGAEIVDICEIYFKTHIFGM